MTKPNKPAPREFWLCGEPNEHDVGIWYDHYPGVDVVYGREFHRHHVIEHSAYLDLQRENAQLKARVKRIQQIVNEQAEDEGLWFIAEHATEAYLQQELRKLHAAIEAADDKGE